MTEQQMSALCIAGCIAFFAITIPPTGICPSPVGQASGITAPPTNVGVFIRPSIVESTYCTFAISSSVSAFMFLKNATGSLCGSIIAGLTFFKYSIKMSLLKLFSLA